MPKKFIDKISKQTQLLIIEIINETKELDLLIESSDSEKEKQAYIRRKKALRKESLILIKRIQEETNYII